VVWSLVKAFRECSCHLGSQPLETAGPSRSYPSYIDGHSMGTTAQRMQPLHFEDQPGKPCTLPEHDKGGSPFWMHSQETEAQKRKNARYPPYSVVTVDRDTEDLDDAAPSRAKLYMMHGCGP